jgi:polar amino acid transport system substrate-binding protein
MPRMSEAAIRELAPSGVLRVGVAVGPAASLGWAVRDPATGEPRGVAVDLGRALAERAGLPCEIVRFASSGEVTEALAAAAIDVAFMPVDDDRRAVAFGPDYALGTSTYLVPAGSPISTIEDLDRSGTRVGGVEATTTIRAAGTAIAVPKGRPAALTYASRFIEEAKADGIVQGAFDRAGLTNATVAPPGSVS